jgi:hypothetical protein
LRSRTAWSRSSGVERRPLRAISTIYQAERPRVYKPVN